MSRRAHRSARDVAGQAIAEFALAFTIFVVLLMAVFDLGRGVYTFNGLSEAAREIARRTSVYPGVTLGQSAETQETIAVQLGLTPGLQPPTFRCLDVAGNPAGHVPCQRGDYVEVTVTAVYQPVAPLPIGGPITLSSSTTMVIP
jgi:hypothetical protein